MAYGFADLFNITEEELINRTTGKKGRTVKKDEKLVKEKGKTAEVKSRRYKLPVRVRCGYIREDFTAEECGGKTLDDKTIKIKLRERYPELSGVSFNLKDLSSAVAAVNEEKKVNQMDKLESESSAEEMPMEVPEFADADSQDALFSGTDAGNLVSVEMAAEGSWLTLQVYYQEMRENQKLTFPLTLVNGEYKIPVDQAMGIEAMRLLWVRSYPEYKGCKLYYDDRRNLIVPFMEIKRDQELGVKEFELPITVGYLDFSKVYNGLDFGVEAQKTATLEEIRKLYGAAYPEYRFSTYYWNEEDNILFPVITNDEKISGNERVSVPVRIRVIGTELVLQESDFKGKHTASLEEIRQALEEIYPEYSKERTEMLVDDRGFVVPVLRGSRKGYYLIPNKYGEGLYVVTGRDGYEYRVEKTPFGIFECRVDGAEPRFYMDAPKVPGQIFKQVIRFFRKTPTKEAAIQLFYLRESGTYEIYIPKQKGTEHTVRYNRNAKKEEQEILFMDIHSHGSYPAFFSQTDNKDEKGTRLYMVIGSLARDPITYSWDLRAGIAGAYQNLKLEDIFEGELSYVV